MRIKIYDTNTNIFSYNISYIALKLLVHIMNL